MQVLFRYKLGPPICCAYYFCQQRQIQGRATCLGALSAECRASECLRGHHNYVVEWKGGHQILALHWGLLKSETPRSTTVARLSCCIILLSQVNPSSFPLWTKDHWLTVPFKPSGMENS